jgi:NAD(P)H-hydrate epimerase
MPKAILRVRRVPRLAPRRREGHKGNYGHVLVVGGSRGMSGAVAMASQSALRGGAGRVTFAAPAAVQLTIAGLCPCATSIALACDDGEKMGTAPNSRGENWGQSPFSPGAVRQVLRAAAGCDVLAAGPGMGVGPGQKNIIRALLEQERPLVIDADGLNNLAGIDGWPELRKCPMVLTPHPGEFSRLTGRKTSEVQADRIGAAVAAAREWTQKLGTAPIPAGRGQSLVSGPNAEKAGTAPNSRGENWVQSPFSPSPFSPLVLVLKGAGTVVTDGRRVYVNTTGNPGMATGGSGDVLTGLLAALMGQGLEPFDAACLAVYVHGLAGDLGAAKLGEVSLTAWDLIDYLPAALKTVAGRR